VVHLDAVLFPKPTPRANRIRAIPPSCSQRRDDRHVEYRMGCTGNAGALRGIDHMAHWWRAARTTRQLPSPLQHGLVQPLSRVDFTLLIRSGALDPFCCSTVFSCCECPATGGVPVHFAENTPRARFPGSCRRSLEMCFSGSRRFADFTLFHFVVGGSIQRSSCAKYRRKVAKLGSYCRSAHEVSASE